ncbi:hypothetical protein [Nannocystis bainbridge]|uniref:ROK family protein n=1 Tax=Nannocystis bainbridge TaxID=2995303 RepID=A0ABT5DU90_9BACT|nr:hypothetical protein [Nannocystis bainbridge]MDC0716604.1 hypothetical protein [Nannocystis bainbridge]
MLARHRDPRVTPVELWDLVVDGAPLYAAPRDASYGRALARAVEALIAGEAACESATPLPPLCRRIDRVVLAGGASGHVRWDSSQVPAAVAAAPERCAEQGGLAVLAGAQGLVVDLGQSRLKIVASDGRRWSSPRDLTAIPISGRPVEGAGRTALIGFVAAGLREMAAGGCERIVMALPCEISPEGALGTCSYPWYAGEPIVEAFLAAAGLVGVPTLLVNDAELAAIGVAEAGVAPGVTLVLTLGFGVGGALVQG